MTLRNAFVVRNAADDARWQTALELLPDHQVAYRGMGFWLDRNWRGDPEAHMLTVIVATSWHGDNLTRARARKDLLEGRDEFRQCLRVAKTLRG